MKITLHAFADDGQQLNMLLSRDRDSPATIVSTVAVGPEGEREVLSCVEYNTVELLRTLRALNPTAFARVMRDE